MPERGGQGEEVKSAARALEILELLTALERPATFVRLERELGYPRSSLHGLLTTLERRGWVELNPETREYSLGIRTWEAGATYMRAIELADRGRPYLEAARDALSETTHLSVLDSGRYNVYVAKADGPHQLALVSYVGRRLEAHATGLGKVLLAGLPADELDRRLRGESLERFTPNTITDTAELRNHLRTVTERGYATDDEERTVGVRCVAVPVRDHRGDVVAAMSVSVPTVRFDATTTDRAREVLAEQAAGLSAALGYQAATARGATVGQ